MDSVTCETISCAPAGESCQWCGAYPNEWCQQPDLVGTPATKDRDGNLPPPPGFVEPTTQKCCTRCIGGCKVIPDVTPVNELDGDETVSYGDSKPDPTMVDPQFILELAKVLDMGADKYARDNWRKGTAYQRRMASAMRHMLAWIEGEDLDPESGLPHLAHAATNCMFLMNWQRRGVGTDDRFKPE